MGRIMDKEFEKSLVKRCAHLVMRGHSPEFIQKAKDIARRIHYAEHYADQEYKRKRKEFAIVVTAMLAGLWMFGIFAWMLT